MRKEYRTRTFKSGNSVALRLPKELGFIEGEEVIIVPHADGAFSVRRASQAKEAFMRLYGSMSAGFMAEGRGYTDQDERDWNAGVVTVRAA